MRKRKICRRFHGHSGTPTHQSWENMLNRCSKGTKQNTMKKADTYRTIDVCPRWKESFLNFLEDMGERPNGTTLDRIDNTKGYFPANCRWATRKEQQRNRSVNRLIEIDGVTKCLSAWLDETGQKITTVIGRLGRGVPVRQAIGLEPYQKKKTGKKPREKVFQ